MKFPLIALLCFGIISSDLNAVTTLTRIKQEVTRRVRSAIGALGQARAGFGASGNQEAQIAVSRALESVEWVTASLANSHPLDANSSAILAKLLARKLIDLNQENERVQALDPAPIGIIMFISND